MSREIKFRMWNDQAEKFHFDLGAFECLKQQFCGVYDHVGLQGAAFEQFTGLQDRNGVDIYEGDVVRGWCHDPEKVFAVVFNASKYCCGFVATDNKESNPYVNIWYAGFEVIGNIHQHPELLEVKS